jgi:hypothetical protein
MNRHTIVEAEITDMSAGERQQAGTVLKRLRIIALMAFPDACSRRILNTVSNTNIPISPPDTCQADSLRPPG